MKVIVITGSTRGIGYGLADSFLALDCQVVVSGRKGPAVDVAVEQLSARYGKERVFGQACEVSDYDQVQALWEAARQRFGKIDIWINNAGGAHHQMNFWEYNPQQARNTILTNLVGAIYGSKVAMLGMLDQGFGAIYNMEGLGSTGRVVKGLGLYGATKAGLSYFDTSSFLDIKGTPIIMGAIRPGMVVTDLLTGQYNKDTAEWERAKRIFNILADRVETITPVLARKVLSNTRSGVVITYTNGIEMMLRFLTAPFVKRKVIDE